MFGSYQTHLYVYLVLGIVLMTLLGYTYVCEHLSERMSIIVYWTIIGLLPGGRTDAFDVALYLSAANVFVSVEQFHALNKVFTTLRKILLFFFLFLFLVTSYNFVEFY